MAQAPAVQIRTPIITKQIAVAAVTVTDTIIEEIPVPYTVVEKVQLYIPIGCNYTLGFGFGYNNKKLIPFDEPNEWIIGPGIMHEYRWGIPVQGNVQLFINRRNRLSHIVYVALHLNYEPIQAAADMRRLVTPR